MQVNFITVGQYSDKFVYFGIYELYFLSLQGCRDLLRQMLEKTQSNPVKENICTNTCVYAVTEVYYLCHIKSSLEI